MAKQLFPDLPSWSGHPTDNLPAAGSPDHQLHEKKGLRLESYTLEPAASQATENVVVTHYWITDRWVDKQGIGKTETSRITHLDSGIFRLKSPSAC
jgi:hypothetical protein